MHRKLKTTKRWEKRIENQHSNKVIHNKTNLRLLHYKPL